MLGQPVDVERHLGDDRPVDAGQVGRDERRLAAVAAEHLHDGEALVRAGARAQLVDEVHRAGDGGGEADAVVGAVDVVVHRLRDGDDRDALVGQAQRERERVVAADRHQRVDAQPFEHAEQWLVKSYGPVADGLVGAGAAGTSAAFTRAGLVRELCSTVPPLRSIVRTTPGSRGTRHEATDAGSSGLHSSSPAQPRRMPTAL